MILIRGPANSFWCLVSSCQIFELLSAVLSSLETCKIVPASRQSFCAECHSSCSHWWLKWESPYSSSDIQMPQRHSRLCRSHWRRQIQSDIRIVWCPFVSNWTLCSNSRSMVTSWKCHLAEGNCKNNRDQRWSGPAWTWNNPVVCSGCSVEIINHFCQNITNLH